ncbi:LytTR family transcriptional regulator DNA-binding domain-containing protein [uncultured Trichococcus sp.]|uniref:LytTR family transcriptional regulator DNA-binding domain-containing protein n=1 Tax=uncultured Trichococcus sp. TaxID=189665 RepID=UPI002A188812|nr:LytTR family transcriptional regulator DNA-binding domain-containing protein [uncultured Trichococcus sp.]
MRVLIVDDEPLARDELAYLLGQCEGVSAVAQADSIEEALGTMLEEPVDLIFLDIHLTNESGLSLAGKINKLKKPPLIIFATAYDDYAVKAFELNATDYVLKPFELERIQQAVKKAYGQYQKGQIKELESPKQNDAGFQVLPIQMDERIYMLQVPEIIAIGVENGETTIYTKNMTYIIHEPLSALERKIGGHPFLRVHRAFLINLKEIKEIQPWFNHTFQLTMSNGLKVPVSRSYMKDFKEKVGI